MPIHDQGYRRYGGRKAPHGQAWAVIARARIRTMLGKKAVVALLIVPLLPFLARAAVFVPAANFPQLNFLAPSAESFHDFLEQQGIWVFFITVFVGSGLIANDRRANALQIYLSSP